MLKENLAKDDRRQHSLLMTKTTPETGEVIVVNEQYPFLHLEIKRKNIEASA